MGVGEGGGGGGGENRSCSKPCIAQAFWSKSANLGPSCEFARTARKRSRNQLEIYLQPGRRRFWEFGAISGTYQNQPYSKPWAEAQVLCSRSGAPAARWSDRKQFEIHLQTCRRKFLGFPAPKSAIFKMGYGPGLLNISQFRTLANPPEIHTDNPATWNLPCRRSGHHRLLFCMPTDWDTRDFYARKPEASVWVTDCQR